MMRKLAKANPKEIEADFARRVMPGLTFCQRVGNIMGATALLSLVSTIEHGEFERPQRVGVFSYGSGCCSEFFSGVVTKEGQQRVRAMRIGDQLDRRCELSMDDYERLLHGSNTVKFGTRNVVLNTDFLPQAKSAHGSGAMFLTEINEFQRRYEWTP